jgi:hypothetical protein
MWTFQVHLRQYTVVIEEASERAIESSYVKGVIIANGIPKTWGRFLVYLESFPAYQNFNSVFGVLWKTS